MTPPTAPTVSPPPMTAEEFVKLHGDDSGVELVNGRVVRLPMPGAEHGEVCGIAYSYVRDVVRANGLGRVMINDTFVRTGTNPDTYRGADVCYLSFTRWLKEQPLPKGPLEVAPELVVEVRSPTDREGEIERKVEEYLRVGVTVVVVLDPTIEAAAVYRASDGFPQRFSNGDELTLPDVLPGFAVPVKKFFE
jgi:Uma2 family endonuclease